MPEWCPNLIMPGVAKCGTTTLHDILVQHPEITGGVEKELRFLMDEEDPLKGACNLHRNGAAAYRSLYRDEGRGAFSFWLDASPEYQYQRAPLDFIRQLDVKPRILFIFREPSERLYSLYQYARYHQRAVRDVASMEEFIAQIKPPAGPKIEGRRMLVNAWEDTYYDRCVERWLDVVPESHLKAISLEQLNQDRDAMLTGIADWLGLDPAPFGRQGARTTSNETVVTHSLLFNRVGKQVARLLPDSAWAGQLKRSVKSLNSSKIDRTEKQRNSGLLKELQQEFRPSVERLHALTGVTF